MNRSSKGMGVVNIISGDTREDYFSLAGVIRKSAGILSPHARVKDTKMGIENTVRNTN